MDSPVNLRLGRHVPILSTPVSLKDLKSKSSAAEQTLNKLHTLFNSYSQIKMHEVGNVHKDGSYSGGISSFIRSNLWVKGGDFLQTMTKAAWGQYTQTVTNNITQLEVQVEAKLKEVREAIQLLKQNRCAETIPLENNLTKKFAELLHPMNTWVVKLSLLKVNIIAINTDQPKKLDEEVQPLSDAIDSSIRNTETVYARSKRFIFPTPDTKINNRYRRDTPIVNCKISSRVPDTSIAQRRPRADMQPMASLPEPAPAPIIQPVVQHQINPPAPAASKGMNPAFSFLTIRRQKMRLDEDAEPETHEDFSELHQVADPNAAENAVIKKKVFKDGKMIWVDDVEAMQKRDEEEARRKANAANPSEPVQINLGLSILNAMQQKNIKPPQDS